MSLSLLVLHVLERRFVSHCDQHVARVYTVQDPPCDPCVHCTRPLRATRVYTVQDPPGTPEQICALWNASDLESEQEGSHALHDSWIYPREHSGSLSRVSQKDRMSSINHGSIRESTLIHSRDVMRISLHFHDPRTARSSSLPCLKLSQICTRRTLARDILRTPACRHAFPINSEADR